MKGNLLATVNLTTLKNISESVYSGLRSYGTINVCLVKPEKSSIMQKEWILVAIGCVCAGL